MKQRRKSQYSRWSGGAVVYYRGDLFTFRASLTRATAIETDLRTSIHILPLLDDLHPHASSLWKIKICHIFQFDIVC